MTESFDNKTNSHNLSVSDALGVLVSAAEARRDQYRDIGDHKGVETATEELWDVGVTEADNMAELISSAIDVYREYRDRILDPKPTIVHEYEFVDDIKKLKPGRVIIGVDPAHPDGDKSVMIQIKNNKPVPFPVNPEICHHPEDARRSLKSPHSGEWCDDCGKIL